MKNKKELEILGNQLSTDYVNSNVDLTDGLRKIATVNNLNRQQIKRVAEVANIDTYLKLANIAEDGYVEFNIANADAVIEEFDKQAEESNSGWDDIKSKIDILDFLQFEKIANDDSQISFNNISKKLLDMHLLEEKIASTYSELVNSYTLVENSVKQAIASDNTIPEIKYVLKTASNSNYDLLLNSLTENLNSVNPVVYDFSLAELEDINEIDADSTLFKNAYKYEKCANELHDEVEQLINNKLNIINEIKDTEHKYYTKEASGKLDWLKRLSKLKPKSTTGKVLAGVGLTGMASIPLGVYMGKKEEQYKQDFREMQEQRIDGRV